MFITFSIILDPSRGRKLQTSLFFVLLSGLIKAAFKTDISLKVCLMFLSVSAVNLAIFWSMQRASETGTIHFVYLLLWLEGGTYCFPQMIHLQKKHFPLPYLSYWCFCLFTPLMTRERHQWEVQTSHKEIWWSLLLGFLIVLQPKDNPENLWLCRAPSSFALAHGSFLLLENPLVRVPRLQVIYSQANKSLFFRGLEETMTLSKY